jgi:Domain of unknown function (DUF4832)/Domain of unknown function (DUF4874)
MTYFVFQTPQWLGTRRWTRAVSLLALATLLSCGGGAGPTSTSAPSTVKASFAPSDADFPNPERGYYKFADDLSRVTEPFLLDVQQQGFRLIYTPNDLSAYKTQALPASYLTGLENGFALVRKHGLKVVLRFAYNYPASETAYANAQDASLAQVQAHIAQLAPIIQANADVIAVWQAGFIGAWGEWHTSSNGLTSAANKLAVRDSLLAVLPAQRQLQVRYPGDLLDWFTSAPTLADALSATPTAGARMGAHNDCFLASPDDVGTYFPPGTAVTARARATQTSAVTAFGGETCAPPVVAEARMNCADILAEGAAYHLAYLNRDYYLPFFTNWEAQKCLPEVARKIGYRLALQQVEHPATAAAGQSIAVSVTLKNDGWARLMNERRLSLRFVHSQTGAALTLPLVEARLRELGAAEQKTWASRVSLPADMPKGSYRLQIAAPDAAQTLNTRADYALRFANGDVAAGAAWDATAGAMGTGTQILIE